MPKQLKSALHISLLFLTGCFNASECPPLVKYQLINEDSFRGFSFLKAEEGFAYFKKGNCQIVTVDKVLVSAKSGEEVIIPFSASVIHAETANDSNKHIANAEALESAFIRFSRFHHCRKSGINSLLCRKPVDFKLEFLKANNIRLTIFSTASESMHMMKLLETIQVVPFFSPDHNLLYSQKLRQLMSDVGNTADGQGFFCFEKFLDVCTFHASVNGVDSAKIFILSTELVKLDSR